MAIDPSRRQSPSAAQARAGKVSVRDETNPTATASVRTGDASAETTHAAAPEANHAPPAATTTALVPAHNLEAFGATTHAAASDPLLAPFAARTTALVPAHDRDAFAATTRTAAAATDPARFSAPHTATTSRSHATLGWDATPAMHVAPSSAADPTPSSTPTSLAGHTTSSSTRPRLPADVHAAERNYLRASEHFTHMSDALDDATEQHEDLRRNMGWLERIPVLKLGDRSLRAEWKDAKRTLRVNGRRIDEAREAMHLAGAVYRSALERSLLTTHPGTGEVKAQRDAVARAADACTEARSAIRRGLASCEALLDTATSTPRPSPGSVLSLQRALASASGHFKDFSSALTRASLESDSKTRDGSWTELALELGVSDVTRAVARGDIDQAASRLRSLDRGLERAHDGLVELLTHASEAWDAALDDFRGTFANEA